LAQHRYVLRALSPIRPSPCVLWGGYASLRPMAGRFSQRGVGSGTCAAIVGAWSVLALWCVADNEFASAAGACVPAVFWAVVGVRERAKRSVRAGDRPQ
jgi:hypothetical protein